MAVSGRTLLIGAPGDDDRGSSAGAAYVLRYQDEEPFWTWETKLLPPFGSDNVRFGRAVSISGLTTLIGAQGEMNATGAAYVFRRQLVMPQGFVWTQQARLQASDGEPADAFGSAVAITGTTALVGAYGDDDAGPAVGAAYVFRYDLYSPDVWTLEAKLLAPDGAETDWIGRSAGLSDDIAAVAAPGVALYGDLSGAAYTWNLADTDGDGVGDECDSCPDTPAGLAVDNYGCTVRFGACCAPQGCIDRLSGDACEMGRGLYQGNGTSCTGDYDHDGTAGCDDGCPFDWGKTGPGVCGCGVPDINDDGDGVMDCVDQCPGPHGHDPVNDCGCPAVGACCSSFGGHCSEDVPRDNCTGDTYAYQGDGSTCFGGCDFGDLDGDDDVDLADFSILQACFTGAGGDTPRECMRADIDGCGDMDLEDFTFFHHVLSGPWHGRTRPRRSILGLFAAGSQTSQRFDGSASSLIASPGW